MPRINALIEKAEYARVHRGRPSVGRDDHGELPTPLEIEEGEAHLLYHKRRHSPGLRAEWERLYAQLLDRQGQVNVSITRCRVCHVTRFGRNGGPCGACGCFLRTLDQARLVEEREANEKAEA